MSQTTALTLLCQLNQLPLKLTRSQYESIIYDILTPNHSIIDLTLWTDKFYFIQLLHNVYSKRMLHDTTNKKLLDLISQYTDPLYLPHRSDICNIYPLPSTTQYADNCQRSISDNIYTSMINTYVSAHVAVLNKIKDKHKSQMGIKYSLTQLFDLINVSYHTPIISIIRCTILSYIGHTLKLNTIYTYELIDSLHQYLMKRITEYQLASNDCIVQFNGGDGRLAYHLTQNRKFTSLPCEYICIDMKAYKPVVTFDFYDKIKSIGDDNSIHNVIDIELIDIYTALNKYKPKIVLLHENSVESTKLKHICAQYNVQEIIVLDEITDFKQSYDTDIMNGYQQSIIVELSQQCVNIYDNEKCYGLTRCINYIRQSTTQSLIRNPIELMCATIDMLQHELKQRYYAQSQQKLMCDILLKENTLLKNNLNLVYKLIGIQSSDNNSTTTFNESTTQSGESIISHISDTSHTQSNTNTVDAVDELKELNSSTSASENTHSSGSIQHTPTTHRIALRAKRKASLQLTTDHLINTNNHNHEEIQPLTIDTDQHDKSIHRDIDLSNIDERPKSYRDWCAYLHQLNNDELRHCLSNEMERNITETNKITKLLNNNKTLPDKLLNELISRCDKLKYESEIFHQLLTDHTITVFNSPHKSHHNHSKQSSPSSPLLHHKRNTINKQYLINGSVNENDDISGSDSDICDPPSKTTRLNNNQRMDSTQQPIELPPINGIDNTLQQLTQQTRILHISDDTISIPSAIQRDDSSVTETSVAQSLSDVTDTDDTPVQTNKNKSRAAKKREKKKAKKQAQLNNELLNNNNHTITNINNTSANQNKNIISGGPLLGSVNVNKFLSTPTPQFKKQYASWIKQINALNDSNDLAQFERNAVIYLGGHVDHLISAQFSPCVELLYNIYMKKLFTQHCKQYKVDDKLYQKLTDATYLPTRAELSATLRLKMNKIEIYDYLNQPQHLLRKQQTLILSGAMSNASLHDILQCIVQYNYVSMNVLYAHCMATQQFELFTKDYIEQLATYINDRIHFYNLSNNKSHSVVILGHQAKQLQTHLYQCNKIMLDIDVIPYNTKSNAFDRLNHTMNQSIELNEYAQQISHYLDKSHPSIVVYNWLPCGIDVTRLFHRSMTVLEYILIGESTSGNCGQLYDTYNVHLCDRVEHKSVIPPCTHKQMTVYDSAGFQQQLIPQCTKYQISCHDQPNQHGSFSSTIAYIRKSRHRLISNTSPSLTGNALLYRAIDDKASSVGHKDVHAVTISVTNNVDSTNLYFKIHTHKTLAPLMRVYCQRKNCTLDEILFMYNKTVLKTTDSCVSVGIKDNENIIAIHKNNTAILDAYTNSYKS